MSTSNSPQTLFRFVSLRNPKLTDVTKTNLGFIHRPEEIVGVFDQVVQNSNGNKIQALLYQATLFEPESIKTQKELENTSFGELINIGRSLSNQQELSTRDLELCKSYLGKYTENLKIKLWDNFIYQSITQKDFYIKENIAFILKALHIGYAQTITTDDELKKINGDNLVSKAIGATIVLPNSIFEGNNLTSSAKNIKTAEGLLDKENNLLSIVAKKNQTEQNYVFEKDIFESLKIELKIIQKKYNTSKLKAYNVALQKFNNENSETIKANENQSIIIQELERNKATEEEIKKANEELKKYKMPPFEFTFKNELNWEDIYKNLSTESFCWFLKYFSDAEENNFKDINYEKAKISIISDDELSINENSIFFNQITYNEIFEIIDNNTIQLNKNFLSKVTLQQDQFVNLGGVLIPVSNNNNQVVHLSYILRAFKPFSFFLEDTNLGYASLQVQVENSSWSVSHASIRAQTNLGSKSETIETIEVINNKINFPQFLTNQFQLIDNLSVQIFFSNGREATLELSNITNNEDLTGILTLKAIKTNVPIDTEAPVSGNHFGLKRLGVAEYMKVVQTVHAYVPGEVSNIENVMASELRHKSISELTRTEDTVTTTKSQEIEKISDTNKVNRAEMQTEVATEIDKQQSFNAHANYSKDTKVWKLDIGTSFASTNAQHISNMQAVTKSQEITERAMERVQSKISEERISKIIHEVSQTNIHEFDNRGGGLNKQTPQHITGVYRWVDKKMKNQIYNYGKRTMFEFMIPEPAKLHRLAHAVQNVVVTAPVDPRKAPAPHNMVDANTTTKEIIEYWANIYKVTLTPIKMTDVQTVSTHYDFGCYGNCPIASAVFTVNSGYVCKSVNINADFWKRGGYPTRVNVDFAGINVERWPSALNEIFSFSGLNLSGDFLYKHSGYNIGEITHSLTLNLEINTQELNLWKTENFNAIIKAYDEEYIKYQAEQARIDAEQKAKEGEQKETQANFYRIIESDLLKHNCIAYLLQDYLSINTIGQQFTDGDKMDNFQVYLNDKLDQYTAVAKFLEQAFEWSIMDYTFYPYYWADRKQWQKMYLSESIDPLFRSFLQAGLARVIVTVKPGFEEAVQYFITTGKVWFGGVTPVIGDPLYMSIAQEMKEPTGKPQGNYWITRIPTTLTILQSGSTGLKTEDGQALPIFPESKPENCENPAQLETLTEFKLDDVQMVGTERATTLNSNT